MVRLFGRFDRRAFVEMEIAVAGHNDRRSLAESLSRHLQNARMKRQRQASSRSQKCRRKTAEGEPAIGLDH